MSSAVRAASCAELRPLTWPLVSASACAVVSAASCWVVSPAMALCSARRSQCRQGPDRIRRHSSQRAGCDRGDILGREGHDIIRPEDGDLAGVQRAHLWLLVSFRPARSKGPPAAASSIRAMPAAESAAICAVERAATSSVPQRADLRRGERGDLLSRQRPDLRAVEGRESGWSKDRNARRAGGGKPLRGQRRYVAGAEPRHLLGGHRRDLAGADTEAVRCSAHRPERRSGR